MSRTIQGTRILQLGMWTVVAFGLAVMASANVASAGEFGGTYLLVELQASNVAGTETAQYSVLVPAEDQHPFDGTYQWSLPVEAFTLISEQSGISLGTIRELQAAYESDPVVSLNFNVISGEANTNFTINSALIQFAAIANPYAYATASVTVTDENGDGGTLTGLLGGKAYQAKYNNASSVYTTILSPVTAAEWDTFTGTERTPPVAPNRDIIHTTVSSISSQFQFQLTAGDSASGTSSFNVSSIPEPATLALLTLGGLAVASRRRRS